MDNFNFIPDHIILILSMTEQKQQWPDSEKLVQDSTPVFIFARHLMPCSESFAFRMHRSSGDFRSQRLLNDILQDL